MTVGPELTVINESSVSFIDLNCYSFGIPPPILTWTKIRTDEVLTSESLIQITESQTLNSSFSVLRIYIPRDPDESNYTCTAVNDITNVLETPENGTVEVYVQGTGSSFLYTLFWFNVTIFIKILLGSLDFQKV